MTIQLAKTASRLFEYPSPSYLASLETFAFECRERHPSAAELLLELHRMLAPMSVAETKELYTRTFDLAPVCAPYLSVHLFGESNLKRAQLMTGLAELFAARGVDTERELPDHIGVLLRSLEKLLPSERTEVLRHCFDASLKRMQAELTRQNNPYRLAIAAVAELVHQWLEQAEVTDA